MQAQRVSKATEQNEQAERAAERARPITTSRRASAPPLPGVVRAPPRRRVLQRQRRLLRLGALDGAQRRVGERKTQPELRVALALEQLMHDFGVVGGALARRREDDSLQGEMEGPAHLADEVGSQELNTRFTALGTPDTLRICKDILINMWNNVE